MRRTEMELRERLAQATQIAADAQSRVDQLQLIETEFKTKDLTIAHLREDINKLQQEISSYKSALQSKPFNPQNINSNATTMNQQQQQQLQPPSASPLSASATTSTGTGGSNSNANQQGHDQHLQR